MKTKWQSSMAIALTLLFVSSVISCSTPAPIPEPPKIEEGWVRLRIKDIGSIDYPTDFLELQSEEYIDRAKKALLDSQQIIILGKSDFTLQQVGLNELLPSSLDEYRRVLFRTDYMSLGEVVFRANEKYTLSQEELAEIKNELIDQLRQESAQLKTLGQDQRIIDSGSLEIIEINGMFPLVHTYKRQLNDNPVVLVKAYLFQNYDMIHNLTFSYRVVDEEECRDIYDKVLDSFRLR